MDHQEILTTADKLLAEIRKKPGVPFALEYLSDKLKVEIDQLGWELIQLLKWGYQISKTKNAVTFLSAPDILSPVEIAYNLKTKLFGQVVHSFKSVKSTNNLAREIAESGGLEGTLIIAEEQTEGRGRFKRSWHSPAGTGIYMSLILRPDFSPEQAPAISLVTALSLATTIEKCLPGISSQVKIKWPNDILFSNKNSGQLKKTSGILTELSADQERINFIIVGVGINVNQTVSDFPDEIKTQATSIRGVLGETISRVKLLQEFLLSFEKNYQIYKYDGLKPMLLQLKKFSSLIGLDIRVASGENIIEGTAIDIDSLGCLIIKTKTGQTAINAGEVTILKD